MSSAKKKSHRWRAVRAVDTPTWHQGEPTPTALARCRLTAQSVWRHLALSYANADGHCRASIRAIEAATGLGRRAIQGALTELIDANLLATVGSRNGGRGRATTYRLTIPKGAPGCAVSKSQRAHADAPITPRKGASGRTKGRTVKHERAHLGAPSSGTIRDIQGKKVSQRGGDDDPDSVTYTADAPEPLRHWLDTIDYSTPGDRFMVVQSFPQVVADCANATACGKVKNPTAYLAKALNNARPDKPREQDWETRKAELLAAAEGKR